MHDSPSSPRRSIAPAPPKQQQPKKAGAPKAKGAVRAKSGCYTCRIRRKVCSTRFRPPHCLACSCSLVAFSPPPLSPPFPPLLSPSRNVMNAQTQRVAAKHASVSASNALALARSAPSGSRYAQRVVHVVTVPGISSSRPFSKENNNVTMFREKIKDFLAAQGMIKGHSGSGARSSEQEGMLVLITDHGRSDTSSPQSPALSVDSSEDRRPNGHSISSIRHDHYPPITLPPQHSHSGYPSQRMSFSSARESSPLNLPRLSAYHHPLSDMADARETMNQELILPFSTSPTSSTILPPPPTSLVSPMSHQSCKNPYRY